MFKKVLIANRGEIALRIQRACRKLGIATVAVYSEADREALHVKEADERVCIGPKSSKESYLNQVAILSAARITGADAIHPGYGFLSENATFANLCRDFGIAFIGPSPEAIELLGDKMRALDLARNLGLPTLSPYSEPAATPAEALRQAGAIGYPVLIKAASGGGGRGMKICRSPADLERFYPMARAEARAAFGDDTIFIERYLEEPRHIEFQIMADSHGNAVYLPERECSLQRRHQKVLEESPSAALSPALRRKMGEEAVRLAQAGGYTTVGTVEFLLDRAGNYYFIEMNPRIQVEHAVSEMVAGIDLIKQQIRLASGMELPYSQRQIRTLGHAVEFRINAECPETWAPSPGTVDNFDVPSSEGVRVDSYLFDGCVVSPHYDSLVAKVIVKGKDRKGALRKAVAALRESKIDGILTNIPLHLKIIAHGDFRKGEIHTGTLERVLANQRGIGRRMPVLA